MKKFEVTFYEDPHGYSPVAEWIRYLNASPTKTNKAMLRKLYYQFERLEYDGPFVGEPLAKQIEGKLWELRPFPYRIFFVVLPSNRILLLHHFHKKTAKTPKREIEKAKRELADWITRKVGEHNEMD